VFPVGRRIGLEGSVIGHREGQSILGCQIQNEASREGRERTRKLEPGKDRLLPRGKKLVWGGGGGGGGGVVGGGGGGGGGGVGKEDMKNLVSRKRWAPTVLDKIWISSAYGMNTSEKGTTWQRGSGEELGGGLRSPSRDDTTN